MWTLTTDVFHASWRTGLIVFGLIALVSVASAEICDEENFGKYLLDHNKYRKYLDTNGNNGCNLTAAKLRGTDFSSMNYLPYVNFSQANLIHANFNGVTSLYKSNFQDADLRGAVFTKAYTQGASFKGANLSGSVLIDANFRNTDLRGADLSGVFLNKTIFEDAKYDDDTTFPVGFVPGKYLMIWSGDNLSERIDSSAPTLKYTCREINEMDALSQTGGEKYPSRAIIKITERKTIEGLRAIAADGWFHFTWKTWEFEDDVERKEFNIKHIEENAYYAPQRYKGHSQFRNFDSSDMWGNLIIPKKTSQKKFYAHYIFQEGDHMGGTLHLVCKVDD